MSRAILSTAWLLLQGVLLSGAVRADEVVDGVAAVVGTEVILQSELAASVRFGLSNAQAQSVPITTELIVQVRDDALEKLIDDKLIVQIARDNRMEPTPEELDLTVQGIADDEGLSVEEIYAAAAQQGLPRAYYREQLGIQLSRMKVMSGSVSGRITVTDEEVRELYDARYGSQAPGERYRVLHILLPMPPEATEADREQVFEAARTIRETALDTGQFAALARQYSRGPTAQAGGLTVFRQEDAPPAIAGALRQLAPGEISPIVETSYGLNIFQFLDSFDPSTLSYDEVSDQLRAELRERKTVPEFQEWLADLKKNRYIEILGAGKGGVELQ